MTYTTDFRNELNGIITSYGQIIRVKYYNESGAVANYDDDVVLTLSGTTWTSGLVQQIDQNRGSTDALLVQQGRLQTTDSILYVNGTLTTTQPFKIGLGSPVTGEFRVIEEGITPSPSIEGNVIYKKLYLRKLTNGSFIGES